MVVILPAVAIDDAGSVDVDVDMDVDVNVEGDPFPEKFCLANSCILLMDFAYFLLLITTITLPGSGLAWC